MIWAMGIYLYAALMAWLMMSPQVVPKLYRLILALFWPIIPFMWVFFSLFLPR